MYIDNPKKLFKDVTSIPTIALYLGRIDEVAEDDLEALISIVYHHKDELWDSNNGGEGSLLWDLGACDDAPNPKEVKAQLRKDSRKLKKIWATLEKEAAEKGYKDEWEHLYHK